VIVSWIQDHKKAACYIPGSIIGSAVVESTNKTLKTVNGLDIPIRGEVRLEVKIDDYSAQVMGLVSDHIPEPVLGIDFISGNKLVLNYAEN